jgi:NADPH2 dehydrogenase
MKLFSSLRIGNTTLKNRIIMAPMQQWKGTSEAYATDYHVEHYSARAKGGVGLAIVESTSVAENGRLFQNDIGILTDNHIHPLRKVVEEVHKYNTPIFIQLCHGGRKSSPENKGKLLAPSAIAFNDEYGIPHEMTKQDIKEVINQFADAARRSVEAGFNGIELHAAHGYLLHQFLSPLSPKNGRIWGFFSQSSETAKRSVASGKRKGWS